jgi:hypothetical protein
MNNIIEKIDILIENYVTADKNFEIYINPSQSELVKLKISNKWNDTDRIRFIIVDSDLYVFNAGYLHHSAAQKLKKEGINFVKYNKGEGSVQHGKITILDIYNKIDWNIFKRYFNKDRRNFINAT